jgi:YesN/AraC family two-component response regulator
MNFQQLNKFLNSTSTFNHATSEEVFKHFQGKYKTIPYKNEKLFIFNDQRPFGSSNHLIQLHRRNMSKVPYHTYHFIVLTYVYEGTITMLIEGKTITLNRGDLIILDKFVPHSVKPTSKNDLGINIILDNNFFDNTVIKTNENSSLPSFMIELMSHQNKHDHFLLFSTEQLPIIRNSIQSILCEAFDKSTFSNEIIDNYIMNIFMSLIRLKPIETNFINSNPQTQKIISEVSSYVNEHYREGELKKLCQQINYSPSHISRIIHQNTGKTFKELINIKRMEKSKLLLQDKSLSVQEVANKVGIFNMTNFYKRFKLFTGKMPKEYRDKLK